MQHLGKVDIWLSSNAGSAFTSMRTLGAKQAQLRWDTAQETFAIQLTDDNEEVISTVISGKVKDVQVASFFTEHMSLKLNNVVYRFQLRNKGISKGVSDVLSIATQGISDATTGTNNQLHDFIELVKSVIPEKVVGHAWSSRVAIITGIAIAVVVITVIVIANLS